MTFFWIFENVLVNPPPPKAATPELHSASGGLAVPPRPIRTAALRHAGERTGVGAPPRRGGAWKSPSRDRLACPPPLFLRRCLLFFFRTPTKLKFRIACWPLEPWTQPWTRDHERACVNSKHNNTRANHGSVQPSPLAVRRIGNASAFRLA